MNITRNDTILLQTTFDTIRIKNVSNLNILKFRKRKTAAAFVSNVSLGIKSYGVV